MTQTTPATQIDALAKLRELQATKERLEKDIEIQEFLAAKAAMTCEIQVGEIYKIHYEKYMLIEEYAWEESYLRIKGLVMSIDQSEECSFDRPAVFMTMSNEFIPASLLSQIKTTDKVTKEDFEMMQKFFRRTINKESYEWSFEDYD